MLDVQGNNIHLTRGDTMFLDIQLNTESGEAYALNEGDKVFFRVKRNASSKDILIQKEVTHDLVLQLDEADTVNMNFGSYYYEVELVTEEGYHFTAIADAEFEITMELENHG